MSFKPKAISIDPRNPFAHDALNRLPEIENLTALITEVEGPFVLTIDGPWGGGKTTFLRLWEAYLKREHQDFQFIKFNSWKTDFADDPLVALAAELDELPGADKNPAWNKAKNLLPFLLKTGITSGISSVSGGVISTEFLEKAKEALEGEAASDIVKRHKEVGDVQTAFIDGVKSQVERLPEDQKNLVIFIDELDRCRPTYAIQLLERIKHLFDCERIVFVLFMDTEQLGCSIEAVYGQRFDSQKYLKRFFDLEYHLQKPEQRQYIETKVSDFGFKYDLGQRQRWQSEIDFLIEISVFIAERFQYTLRDINQLFTRLKIVLLTVPDNLQLEMPYVVLLLALKNADPALYRRFESDQSAAEEVIKLFENGIPNSFLYSNPHRLMVGYLIASAKNANEGDTYKRLLGKFSYTATEGQPLNPKQRFGEEVVELANHLVGERFQSARTKVTLRRIGLAEKIVSQ